MGAYRQGRRDEPLLRGGDPRKHPGESAETSLPLDVKSRLPGDVIEAAGFNLPRVPQELKARGSSQIRELRKGEEICMRRTSGWRNSLSDDQ